MPSRTRIRERLGTALFGGLRLVFRALPLGPGARDRLRGKILDRFPQLIPAGPRGATPSDGLIRRAQVHAAQRALGHVGPSHAPLPSPLPATLVAFYLPQFHAIRENDEWWGPGFTEWSNVTRALPQFEGHAQPRLPADLGFYDLRNPQVMRDQARLAHDHGIGAFCFYFYWFAGKTLLEAPLDHWLRDTSIELPFCLCWANEDWSRRWDGRPGDVLIGQSHSAEDDLAFIAHIARYLNDPRYLRVDGKPLLLVYRPGLLPDPAATAIRWRHWCREHGAGEIFIAYVQGFERPDPNDIGFDAAVEFPPNLATPPNITPRQSLVNPHYGGQVLDWRMLANDYRHRPVPNYRLFPGVNCGWDNEPRRPGLGRTYLHASPHAYGRWLQETIARRLPTSPGSERLVFINAWNEWAEGAVLEPDARLGHAWLHATRRALQRAACSAAPTARPSRPCVVVHAWYPDEFEQVMEALGSLTQPFRLIVTTATEVGGRIQAILERYPFATELEILENRGRDILPFLRVAHRLRDEGEELVLKLHGKRSTHRVDGLQWKDELLQRLVADSRFASIIDAFSHDATLGVVAPEGHVLPLSEYMGANGSAFQSLLARMGIDVPPGDGQFVAGSMFWVRLSALEPLLDAHLDEWLFEEEAGQIDGTWAHAVERVFALSARAAGMRLITAAAACGEMEPADAAGSYRYARKS